MGGGGAYYTRDTSDGYARNAQGVSRQAEAILSSKRVDPGLLMKDRRLVCNAVSPIVLAFDKTGSMDVLPKVFCDKMPLVAGQLAQLGYLEEPEICLAAVGDILGHDPGDAGDEAPFQVADFSRPRDLDDWLKRIWLEGGGGGQAKESYELMAYYFARRCELPNAVTPFCIFTGDEGFRDTLFSTDLANHLGGTHERVDAAQVFAELRKRFHDNVFLVHRPYFSDMAKDAEILRQWEGVLGRERIAVLAEDQAVADTVLGILALRGGTRDLDEYADDLRFARDRPQSEQRIANVRRSLEGIASLGPARPPGDELARFPNESR